MLERIITALVLVAVVLSCMFATTSQYPMLALMIIAAGGAGYEWYKLMPHTSEQVNKIKAGCFGVLTALLSTFALYCNDSALILWCASIVVWVVSIYWVRKYPELDSWYNKSLYIIGLIIISAAVSSIFNIWSNSPWWLMYLFLLVWGADSGAYFVGRKIGKRKLAPTVSPNKSIEGVIGGVVTVAIVIILVQCYLLDFAAHEHFLFLIISLIAVFSSILGDLFESMIKRRAGIKDSGRILPGHGGVLDRIDSLLSAAPIFAVGLYILKLIGVDI